MEGEYMSPSLSIYDGSYSNYTFKTITKWSVSLIT